ncbi:MAG: glycogen/starch/alpha-glucan phosphorylase, partial [Halanaerobiaceae bacterium]
MFENKEEFKKAFISKIKSTLPKPLEEMNNKDAYCVLVSLLKEDIYKNWVKTNQHYREKGVKQVYYFSIEYLIGKLLISNLINMGIMDICQEGLTDLGFNLDELEAEENEAGLGNGGLGRLAACFLDSLASQELPGHGCGIRYKYGLFNQKIINGNQVEVPDFWLNGGYMWEVRRPEKSVEVHFGGDVEVIDSSGELDFIHKSYEKVIAVPYDIPIVG